MRVLVTGHAGYLGTAMIPVLRKAGHEPTGLDTGFYRGCELRPSPEAPSLPLDIRDVTADHLAGFGAVVHLAALSNDPLGDLDPELTAEINFRSTVKLAQEAKRAGVRRFVFSSSCSMYGATGTDAVTEDAPLAPLTAYAESKVRSEEALSGLADDHFSPVFLRNATAYGVSPALRLDLVLNNLVAWAHTTGEIRILSDGSPWRPLVHVHDIARAVVAVLAVPAERSHAQAFNVGADAENYRVRELARLVQEQMPDCSVTYAGTGDPDPRSYRVSFRKFHATFPDFALVWSARTGVHELLDAYRGARLTLADFQGDRYTRLKRLQTLQSQGALDDGLRWTGVRGDASHTAVELGRT